jgi:hypothetical protein
MRRVGRAMVKKLIAEIAWSPAARSRLAAAR